jgi:hypothetical protein
VISQAQHFLKSLAELALRPSSAFLLRSLRFAQEKRREEHGQNAPFQPGELPSRPKVARAATPADKPAPPPPALPKDPPRSRVLLRWKNASTLPTPAPQA